MDVTDAVRTRIDVREYADGTIDDATREAILDAGRLAPSGRNLQHWHFVLVDGAQLEALADASPTGGWVAGADFAIAVLTDPEYAFNELDAGRASSHMQLDAWGRGVASGFYTVDTDEAREVLAVPDDRELTAVVGFGKPPFDVDAVQGKKDREPLSAVASAGRYGEPLPF